MKRKQYSTVEISLLEAIFKSSKGHPTANIIQRTAEVWKSAKKRLRTIHFLVDLFLNILIPMTIMLAYPSACI